ncbi:MAG: hypothetical protein PHV34_23690 [Verrucomicrobiae bacterium]|nr:hypothetical protein [Verrucomicrobiae bacterium]
MKETDENARTIPKPDPKHLHNAISAEAVGTAGDHPEFIVEALDHGIAELASNLKPIPEERFMCAQHSSHLAHGFDSGLEGLAGPQIQEILGPGFGTIMPEIGEVFLEDVSADRAQIMAQELTQGYAQAPAEIFPAFKQCPTQVDQQGFAASPAHGGGFFPAGGIDGFIELLVDVKAIQNVDRMGNFFGDNLQVGLPHIRADKTQTVHEIRTQFAETSQQSGFGAFFTHPKQTTASRVDLVNQGQKAVGAFALAPMDLVNADGLNSQQRTMFQAPFDNPFHGRSHAFCPKRASPDRQGRMFPVLYSGTFGRGRTRAFDSGHGRTSSAIAFRPLFQKCAFHESGGGEDRSFFSCQG